MPRLRKPPARPKSRWPWLSVIPLGLGAWAPIFAGLRAGRPRWIAFGAVWSAAVIAGWVMASINANGAGGGFIIFGWVAGIVHSFSVRREYDEITGVIPPGPGAVDDSLEGVAARAEHRIRDRDHARQIAEKTPEVAREMGLGRPDLPGAHDFGLVDLNNAPQSAIAKLPGVDSTLASDIVQTRQRVNGFASVDDMGAVMDLDGALVQGIAPWTICLPRPGPAETSSGSRPAG